MKNPALKYLTPAIASACLGLCLSTNKANAQSQYFTTVANGGTYSWDGANWNASGSTANTGPYTSNWTPGDFARFYNGANDSYVVTVNTGEVNTGLYNDAAGSTLTINDAGGGTGNLTVVGAIQGFLSTSGSTTVINVPITGSGGVAPELSGSIYLNAANTYIGGTALGDSGNTLTYFNNNNAFSTGEITLNRTANFSTLLAYGGTTLTLANNFATVAANTGASTDLNFASAANTPVVSTGTWSLGTVTLGLRNNGNNTAPLTLQGQISGSGGLTVSGANGGTIHLAAVNTYTGATTIGVSGGNTAITLELDAANAISSSSQINLAGGALSPGGFNHTMSGTTLDLTASSTIDYTLGGSLSFADSSGVSWGSGDVLNLADWTAGSDELYFAGTGLTAAQLADIEFDGNSSTLGSAQLDDGYIVEATPEPSTIALGLIGGLGVFLMRRKKA